MARVFLSLGSNISRDENIAKGLKAIHSVFGAYVSSSIYESEAVGFVGENFYNLVVEINTDKTVGKLLEILRDIENANGRDRSSPKFSARTLDIDILTYDELCGVVDGVSLPRGEILTNAFVLQPLAEIAPKALHPEQGISYSDLWEAFDKKKQNLWVVPFQIPCGNIA